MAEMVPYEFWSYMNSAVKMKNPDAFVGRSIQPLMNTANIRFKMDYLYKVEPMIN
jgi:hypothetical protein